MGYHNDMLRLAAKLSRTKKDDRHYFLGAVGLRSDGVLVAAANGNPKEPTPEHHAEFRLCRKLTKESSVWVSRTLFDGTIALARPCHKCLVRMKACKVTEVFYSITNTEYGCIRLG